MTAMLQPSTSILARPAPPRSAAQRDGPALDVLGPIRRESVWGLSSRPYHGGADLPRSTAEPIRLTYSAYCRNALVTVCTTLCAACIGKGACT